MNILSFVKIGVYRVNDVVRESALGHSWLAYLSCHRHFFPHMPKAAAFQDFPDEPFLLSDLWSLRFLFLINFQYGQCELGLVDASRSRRYITGRASVCWHYPHTF